MKIPKSVMVGGTRVKVQVKELDDAYGQFLYDKMRIELNVDLLRDPVALRETLRHELVEASLLISGVGWSEQYEQESVVRALDNIFWPAWDRVLRVLDSKTA
jgi:hypothetical protein